MALPRTPTQQSVTSLDGFLAEMAAGRPAATALVVAGSTWTYRDLEEVVGRMARALDADGVRPGDRVAALSRNSCELVALHFAAANAGAIFVPLNWRMAAPEVAAVLADAEPSLLLAQREWAELLAETAPRPPLVWLDGPAEGTGEGERTYEEWLAIGDADALADALADAPADARQGEAADEANVVDPVVLMLYTTGTTGRPKGVMLSAGSIVATLEEFVEYYGLDAETRYLACFPLFHVGGMFTFLGPLRAGGTVISLDDTSEIARTIAETRATHTGLVPTLLTQFVHEPLAGVVDLSRLQVMGYGAAPSSNAIIARAKAMLPGCAFVQGYGMTETTGPVTMSAFTKHGDDDEPAGTVGRVVNDYLVRIVDPATLEDLPVGSPGEIWVHGPRIARGYWHRPEETAAAFRADGWLRTGDVGVFDEDGYLYIKDRIKDMIISGGENVYSVEVENLLMTHPDVREVAVYGVPHERWGETVKAVVALAPGGRADAEALIEYTRERLAHYKCPTVVEFMDILPKSANGKIVKHQLRSRDRGAVPPPRRPSAVAEPAESGARS